MDGLQYISLEPDSRDTRNIIVNTDHFTKCAVAVPTRDQKARTVAKALWKNFVPPRIIPGETR